jgi:hypothetical protein
MPDKSMGFDGLATVAHSMDAARALASNRPRTFYIDL